MSKVRPIGTVKVKIQILTIQIVRVYNEKKIFFIRKVTEARELLLESNDEFA